MARPAARTTRGSPGPLSALGEVVVNFHKPRSGKVPAGDAEFIERRIDAESAGGQSGEQVQESERALRIGRCRREGGRRNGERRGRHVSPSHGPSWEGSAGAGGMHDDHRANGDPLENRAVDLSNRKGQKSRRWVQPHIRGSQRR